MIRRAVTAAALLLTVMLLLVAPATAHDGEGVITVEKAETASANQMRFTVRLTWQDDGHAALGATLTATPLRSTNVAQTPVVLDPIDQDGRYSAVVGFTGAEPWTVRFTAISPSATVEQQISSVITTASATMTSQTAAIPTGLVTTAPGTTETTAPPTTGAAPIAPPTTESSDSSTEPSRNPSTRRTPIIAAISTMLIIAVGGLVFRRLAAGDSRPPRPVARTDEQAEPSDDGEGP